METVQTPAENAGTNNPLYDAHVRWSPECQAIPKEDLLTSINVDIPSVVSMVRGATKQILPLRERCVVALPEEDLSVFDRVESQVLALAYAHAQHQNTQKAVPPLQDISARCVFKHDILSTALSLGIKRGLLPAQALRDLRGPVGYKNQAADLVAMVALYRDHREALAGRIGLDDADINEAESLAYQLYGAIGERDQMPVTVAATTEARQRMFTLFMRTYDSIRRIVHYLRWDEGDADEIGPSVYAGRRRKDSDLKQGQSDGDTTPAAQPEKPAAAQPKPANDVPVGMPGSSALMDAE